MKEKGLRYSGSNGVWLYLLAFRRLFQLRRQLRWLLLLLRLCSSFSGCDGSTTTTEAATNTATACSATPASDDQADATASARS